MGSSDLQIVFPVVIFVLLLCLLFSFFTVTSDNEFTLEQRDVSTPFADNRIVGFNNSTAETGTPEEKESGFDFWKTIAGVVMLLIPVTAFFLNPGMTAGSLILGGGLGFVGVTTFVEGLTGENVFNGIPILGDISNGISYVGTALGNFVKLISWGPDVLKGFPILAILIGVPLGFFFFVFVIRFLRGQ